MCAAVEEIGEEARRATPMNVPRGPSESRNPSRAVQILVRMLCQRKSKRKSSPHPWKVERPCGIPVVQMDYAFLHNTGDKDAEVTFLTVVDNSSGSMVAMAVQKKGHDKFVERFLLKGLESFGGDWRDGAPDGQRNGTDRCGGQTRGS